MEDIEEFISGIKALDEIVTSNRMDAFGQEYDANVNAFDLSGRRARNTRGIRMADSKDNLRPSELDDIIGQSHIKTDLKQAMRAAKARQENLYHVLFYGPAGLGKTTFAAAIAGGMGHRLKHYNGPDVTKMTVIEMASDLINHMEEPTIIFIDEIHRVAKDAMTLLLPLAEDFEFGEFHLPPFTLVGATTDPEMIIPPLRDRFQMKYELSYYSEDEIYEILTRSLRVLTGWSNFRVAENIANGGDAALRSLAVRSRGVPRVANNYLRRTLDYMLSFDPDTIDPSTVLDDDRLLPLSLDIVVTAMTAMSIDVNGLTQKERLMLTIMLDRFGGRPVGVKSIAAAMGESDRSVEGIMEPILVRQGYINRDRNGRTLTAKGIVIAGLEMGGMTRFSDTPTPAEPETPPDRMTL